MGIALIKGTTLQKGKYTIVKSLGQGSFGITYLATTKLTMMGKLGQMDTTVNVAIKEFFMSEMNSRSKDGSSIEGSSGSLFSNYRQKFKKEAENLSKLDHSNIVNVLDVFDENNTTYYVMQYIDGQSLDDYILQQDGINESKAISILKEIGKAVQYMHSNKMLHLDLKPKNVMLDKDGIVYLIDFGLSKQYDSKGEPESSTKVGAGTPGYAPIEQANYREGKGFPVTMDVYALGGTMFKMLTGVRPPEASEILNEGFPTEELQKVHSSSGTIEAIEKAMAPIKKNRFQSINTFIESFACYSKKELLPDFARISVDDFEKNIGYYVDIDIWSEIIYVKIYSLKDNYSILEETMFSIDGGKFMERLKQLRFMEKDHWEGTYEEGPIFGGTSVRISLIYKNNKHATITRQEYSQEGYYISNKTNILLAAIENLLKPEHDLQVLFDKYSNYNNQIITTSIDEETTFDDTITGMRNKVVLPFSEKCKSFVLTHEHINSVSPRRTSEFVYTVSTNSVEISYMRGDFKQHSQKKKSQLSKNSFKNLIEQLMSRDYYIPESNTVSDFTEYDTVKLAVYSSTQPSKQTLSFKKTITVSNTDFKSKYNVWGLIEDNVRKVDSSFNEWVNSCNSKTDKLLNVGYYFDKLTGEDLMKAFNIKCMVIHNKDSKWKGNEEWRYEISTKKCSFELTKGNQKHSCYIPDTGEYEFEKALDFLVDLKMKRRYTTWKPYANEGIKIFLYTKSDSYTPTDLFEKMTHYDVEDMDLENRIRDIYGWKTMYDFCVDLIKKE